MKLHKPFAWAGLMIGLAFQSLYSDGEPAVRDPPNLLVGCAAEIFDATRELVARGGQYAEARLQEDSGALQLMLHRDEEKISLELRRLTWGSSSSRIDFSNCSAANVSALTLTELPGEPSLEELWKEVADMKIPIWPPPKAGGRQLQIFTSSMMNRTALELWEDPRADPATGISSFWHSLFSRVAVLSPKP